MSEFWYDYIINDLENAGYRVEDIILHAMTGVIMGITVTTKSYLVRIKKFLKNLINN